MIRVLVVDDHPAVRLGLVAALRGEPGLVPIGSVASAEEALEALDSGHPDVVLVDHHLPGEDGVQFTFRLRRRADSPAVVLYSGFGDGRLALAARLAGASALLDKAAPVEALFNTVREAARGGASRLSVGPDVVESTALALEPEDIPLFSMALAGEPPAEIAALMASDESDVEHRLKRLLSRLVRPARK